MNNSNLSKMNNKTIQPQIGYTGSKVFGILLLILVIIVIGYASYWLYNYYSTISFVNKQELEVLTDPTSASTNINVNSSTIPNSNFSNEYSISFWINIKDFNYNYGKEKVILRRGNAGVGNPEIVLDKKTNDLIVRVKLQGIKPNSESASASASTFADIPISLTLNDNGYITSNLDNNYKETFTISSLPASVNFNKNHEFNELLDTKIAVNNIDYPTIQYISDNPVLNNKYFQMISGNNINNNCNGYITENFDNISDATNALVLILTDMCEIATYLKSSKVSDNVIDSINFVFNTIIELIENIHNAVKNGNSNLAGIQTQFNSKMSQITSKTNDANLLSNNELKSKFDKLNADLINLKNFAGVVIDYTVLQSAINTKMLAINCPLTFDGTTVLDGNLSFLENVVKLIKNTLYTFLNNLSNSIKNNSNIISGINNTNLDDPTVGKCIVKMIPQQKWVNIIVSVYNQIIDIYVDGQLSSSCVLKKFPDISTSSVSITPDGGFSGLISRVKFTNSAMTIQEAKHIYYAGPIQTQSIFYMIPRWVYWSILAIIIIVIIYSVIM